LALQTQSFDQTFDNMNAALKMSCVKGLPVRVVRSFKEKRSSYAPSTETPVRYDGIYRILRCWRKKGAQGFLMCRSAAPSLKLGCGSAGARTATYPAAAIPSAHSRQAAVSGAAQAHTHVSRQPLQAEKQCAGFKSSAICTMPCSCDLPRLGGCLLAL